MEEEYPSKVNYESTAKKRVRVSVTTFEKRIERGFGRPEKKSTQAFDKSEKHGIATPNLKILKPKIVAQIEPEDVVSASSTIRKNGSDLDSPKRTLKSALKRNGSFSSSANDESISPKRSRFHTKRRVSFTIDIQEKIKSKKK